MTGWDAPPVDDVGYIPSRDLLAMSDGELRVVVEGMRLRRYTGWRNHNGRWRDLMGLDELEDKDILDFGCGVGLETMELARRGNRMTAADIHQDNVWLAQRVCRLYGQQAYGQLLPADPPYPPLYPATGGMFDVFYASGSLHHCRHPVAVMRHAHRLLRPGGEARLMLYSDIGWRLATGTPPPLDVANHPAFLRFLRYFDAVGDWAEWYSRGRLQQRFGQWFEIERFGYLTPDDRFCAAVLRRKP